MVLHSTRLRSRRIVLLILFIVFLVLLVLTFKATRKDKVPINSNAPISNSQVTVPAYDQRINDPNKSFDIVVEHEKIVKGPSKIIVNKGDTVRVNLTAIGEEAKVHLEVYDIITEHDPSDNVPGGFSFVADKQGTFDFYALGEASADGTPNNSKKLLGSIIVK